MTQQDADEITQWHEARAPELHYPAEGSLKNLRAATAAAMQEFFSNLQGFRARDLHAVVLSQVEPALLQATLRYCEGNQSLAALLLGLNRATLRKMLRRYNINPRTFDRGRPKR